MPNAIWKGNISFGLVNIPISLYSAEDKSAQISFRQIDKRNKARIKHQRINVKNGKEVPWEDVVRGYEYEKDHIMIVEEGELERVAGENAQTIAIEEFIDKKNINHVLVERTYYLVPAKKSEKGYVILREALNKTNKVGIAKIIISTKEYLAAVATFENALVVYLLRYDDEIRKISDFDIPSENLNQYKISKKEIEIAEKLITSMTEKWKPEKYKDEYKIAVDKWLMKKIRHQTPDVMKKRGINESKTTNIVDFVGLLKKSLATKRIAKNEPVFGKVKKPKIHNKRKAAK